MYRLARRVVTGRAGGWTFGLGAGGHCRPQTTTARLIRRPPAGTVRVAGRVTGCQSVAVLPSTAASAGAPGSELVAWAARQRTASDDGIASGRRVGSPSVC